MNSLPFILAAITIVMPFVTRKTGLSKKHGFVFKMLCAFFYILTGVFSAFCIGNITSYSAMVLAGLASGILGDFFLEYKKKRFFPLGVVFFAVGHILYSVTFLLAGEYKASAYIWAVVAITLILTVAVLLFAGLKLTLKGKKQLLLAYAPVLIFAFACALVKGALAATEGNSLFALCLIAGGTLFFASDIMIGVDKGGIKRPEFLHNAVSYTYFAAQALFALSIYFQ